MKLIDVKMKLIPFRFDLIKTEPKPDPEPKKITNTNVTGQMSQDILCEGCLSTRGSDLTSDNPCEQSCQLTVC